MATGITWHTCNQIKPHANNQRAERQIMYGNPVVNTNYDLQPVLKYGQRNTGDHGSYTWIALLADFRRNLDKL